MNFIEWQRGPTTEFRYCRIIHWIRDWFRECRRSLRRIDQPRSDLNSLNSLIYKASIEEPQAITLKGDGS